MTNVPAGLEGLLVDIDSVRPHPENPRNSDTDRIAESLRVNGQYRPLVVQAGTRYVIAGNHTLAAAVEMGWKQIAATVIECSAEQARRIMIVDNRTADLGGYDDELLADLLREFDGDLAGTGYNEVELDNLLASLGHDVGTAGDTPPGALPAEPKTRRGDLYLLGRHRLLCGDATQPDDVDLLLVGERPDLVYTDPPYGMSYKSQKHQVMLNDDLRGDDLLRLVRESLRLAADRRADGAAMYVWCSWRTYPEFVYALGEAGATPSACIVWSKGRPGPGASHYRPEHEFCLYCRPEEEGDHELCIYCAGDYWEGGRGLTDVWEVSRDTTYLHPTQKPVELAERAFKPSLPPAGLVLDLFAGSGATVIAAENLHRRACLMELDPAFCDVIVDRWERHTGSPASVVRGEELIANGAAVDPH